MIRRAMLTIALLCGCSERRWEMVSRELVSEPGFEFKLLENSERSLTFAIAVEENTGGEARCASPVTSLRTVDDEASGVISARLGWSRRGCVNPEIAVYTIRLKNRGVRRARFGVRWRRSPSYCLLALVEDDEVTMIDVHGDCSAPLPVRS